MDNASSVFEKNSRSFHVFVFTMNLDVITRTDH